MDSDDLFDREIKFMERTRHRNVVLFCGWGRMVTGQMRNKRFLVTEYMERGSLEHLLKNSDIQLTYEERIRIALDTAKGMDFLHSRGRIHRDLKSANLLVSRDFVVKVADFGSVRALSGMVDTAVIADTSEQRIQQPTRRRLEETEMESLGCDLITPLLRAEYPFYKNEAVVGTRLYMAPERLNRHRLKGDTLVSWYGAPADVYRYMYLLHNSLFQCQPVSDDIVCYL